MNNNGISERQNKSKNIDLLAAQRQLYYEAKKMTYCQFIISVLVPIMIPFLKKVCSTNDKQLALIVLFSMVIVVLNTFCFEKIIKTKREKAAKIQELFDTDVLKLSWNNNLCGAKNLALTGTKINSQKYKKRNKSLENLMDWYSKEYSTVDITSGRIMCQRVNVSWDKELRQNFQKFLLITLITSLIIIISYSIFENKPFTETIISIIGPLFPITFYVFKKYCENKDTIDRLEKLNDKSQILWEQVLKGNTSELNLESDSRKLQNDIYKYRSSALMIGDWFYFMNRTNQEVDMGEIAKNEVDEYKNTRSM